MPKPNLKCAMDHIAALLRVAETPEHPDHQKVINDFSHCDAFEDAWRMFELLNRVHSALGNNDVAGAMAALDEAGWWVPPVAVPFELFQRLSLEVRVRAREQCSPRLVDTAEARAALLSDTRINGVPATPAQLQLVKLLDDVERVRRLNDAGVRRLNDAGPVPPSASTARRERNAEEQASFASTLRNE